MSKNFSRTRTRTHTVQHRQMRKLCTGAAIMTVFIPISKVTRRPLLLDHTVVDCILSVHMKSTLAIWLNVSKPSSRTVNLTNPVPEVLYEHMPCRIEAQARLKAAIQVVEHGQTGQTQMAQHEED